MWKGLPIEVRIALGLTLLIALVYGLFKLKKFLEKPQAERIEEKKASSANAVKAATTELAKLKAHSTKTMRPRYSDADYKKWADQLFNAMNYAGTNTTVITEVFGNMYNRADVLSLIDAYGLRQLKFFGTDQNNGTTNLIQSLTEEGALEAARKGLTKHNVYYQL